MELYNVVLAFLIGISAAAAYYLGKRTLMPGARPLLLWFMLVTVWLVSQSFYYADFSLPVKMLMLNIRFLPVAFIPPIWLLFTKEITGNTLFLTRKNITLLFIVPILTNIVVWTNHLHHMFFRDYTIVTVKTCLLIEPLYGIFFWVHVTYSYLLIAFGLVTLGHAMYHASLRHKRQYLTLKLAILIPLFANIVFNFGGDNYKYIDFTAVFMMIGAMLCLFSVFAFKIIEFVPLTRATIIENMEDIFISFDGQGRMIDFNLSAREEFGFANKNPKGRSMDDVLKDWPELLAALKTMIKEQEGGTVKINQNNQYYSVKVTLLFDRNTRLTGIYLVLRCTSEFEEVIFRYHNETVKRIQAEEKSKYLLQALEYNPVCFVLTDAAGNIQYVNKSFTEITGYSSEEVMNQNPRILNAKVQTEEYYKELWNTITQGKVWQGEFCNKKKNGELYWEKAIISPFYSEDGTLSNFIGIKIDITRTKKMERELTYSEEFLNTIFHKIPSILFVKDIDNHRFVRVNKACANYVGVSEEQMINHTAGDFFPSALAEEFHASDRKVIETGQETEAIELHPDPKNNTVRYIHSRKVLVNGVDGRPAYILGISDDITQKIILEKELIRAKEAAEAANHAKGEFIANMSHEIRTPMNAILGMLQLILQMDLTDQQREYIDIVHLSSKSLMKIIGEVLDYAKIESGKMVIENIEFNLHKMVSQVINLNKIYAQQKGLELFYEIGPEVPVRLLGDSQRLSQVLSNLIGNAIKFTDVGYVSVKVKKEVSDDGKDIVRFSVKDTGVGIRDEAQDNLFKPFVQADTSITRKYGGTGLGLTISKHFIECMGGHIWFDSSYGKGSEFTFYIPCATHDIWNETQENEKTTDVATQYYFRGVRVLITEDNTVNQMVAREILGKVGFEIDIADNGKTALTMLGENHYDIVLMDIQMPVMDGYEAITQIRKNPKYDHLPVLAMTAHNISEDRDKAIALGMNDYVQKPFEIGQLYQTLDQWIGKTGVQNEKIKHIHEHL